MTREEAIKVLNMVEAHGLADEAKRMAIEALEQEPRKGEVILTKEEYGKLISNEFEIGYAKGYREALEQESILDNCIEIPECATNGDMIKAMFPYGKYGTNGDWVHVYGVGGNGCLTFTLDWWNAPYKKGDK